MKGARVECMRREQMETSAMRGSVSEGVVRKMSQRR